MAHFAQLDENDVVVQVIVVANEDILNENEEESEEIGVAFCKQLFGLDTVWVQTSYNGSFRKHYAGKNYTYDRVKDKFIPPQPYPSWTLDEENCVWYAPLPRPDANMWFWDEELHQSDNTQGWVSPQ